MIPGRVAHFTRDLGKPADWDEARDGHCSSLPIRDEPIEGYPTMLSAWTLLPGQLERLQAGAPVMLRIFGVSHPVVSLDVGEPPE
ncbi:hypothetical protein [Phenylobacterium sp.]|uniref:hypothetical protein n=1 Tax=Phenylobacterium sp. TaxID=1871053 RepID=UPI002732DB34|nr:hypothetical protein [Phenylobacterium sp.]MDP3853650.1 hypothetical protein [Phenylobacterium sp.]